MAKVTYIIKASNETVSENAANVLVVIAKKDFITSAEVREALEGQVSPSAVNSNIGVLIKKGLVEKSGDGLVITGEATDLLSDAAKIYAEENKPELVKERKTRQPRGTTEEMEETIEFIKNIVEKDHEVKEIEVNRSNMGVVLAKRLSSGVRKIEVMRKGTFRIFGYKVNEDKLKEFEALGMTYRVSPNGNAYIDMTTWDNNFIENVLKAI